MAFKRERLEKIIERELGSIILSGTKDERLKFVTITKVDLTNDLSIATIYYTVLGNDAQLESTSKNLEEAKGFLRTSLAKRIDVKKTPELRFRYDDAFDRGNRIESILKALNVKDEE